MTIATLRRMVLFCLVGLFVICFTGISYAKKVEITLYATDGFVTMPDGKEIYVWGFTKDPDGPATLPAPPIIVDEGDDVYLTLINKMMLKAKPPNHEPHTIHLHGIVVPTEFDGVPDLSFPVGARYTYFFEADIPGTYMYHCHVQTPKHVQMGMFGALVVRPKMGPNYTYNDEATRFDKEYLFVLGEIDSRWHESVYEDGGKFNPVDFKPDYWTINGRSFPDTANDPSTMIKAKPGENILIRFMNMGMQSHAMHIHGTHGKIIGKDAMQLAHAQKVVTVHISPGETYDFMVNYPDMRKLSEEYKRWMKFPQRYLLHDHLDYTVTNNGEYPGGMLTIIELAEP